MPRRRKASRQPKIDDSDQETEDLNNTQIEDEDNSEKDVEKSADAKSSSSKDTEYTTPSIPPTPVQPQRTGRRGRPPGSKNKNNIGFARDTSHPARSLRHATPLHDKDDDFNDFNDDPAPSRRGGRRGGRWATRGGRKAGTTHTPSLVDSNGNPLVIENDEIVLPTNPKGETKISSDGELLGGRQFRVRTFTVAGRGTRHYMLSTEPARCMGFRDSYLLFQKHKSLYKIIISDDEKYDLIERNLIPHSYKGRAIGIVTARSVYREFGAKIVVGGRRVIDDYDEEEAKSLGYREGEIADPTDRLPPTGVPYNKNQYVAWHGASSVYHQYTNNPHSRSDHSGHGMGFGSSLNLSGLNSLGLGHGNKESYVKRKKLVITDENWMYEHALAALEFNHEILERRKRTFTTLGATPEESVANCEAAGLLIGSSSSTPGGVYEPYTGLFFYPQSTQPKRARYTQLSDKLDDKELHKLGIKTEDDQVPTTKTEQDVDEEDEDVVKAGRRRKEAIKQESGALVKSNNSLTNGDSSGAIGKQHTFVVHPQIVIDTQISLHHPLVPLTGLASVPNYIFENAPAEIKQAILNQQKIENSVLAE